MDIVIKVFVYSWIVTILFGVIITISSSLFKSSYDYNWEGLVPLYNLFGLCGFNGYNELTGLLFLLPGVNIIWMMINGYKLRESYSTSSTFNVGLLLLPAIFIPILAFTGASSNGDDDDGEIIIKSKNSRKKIKYIEHKSKEEKGELEEEEVEEVPQESPTDITDDSIFKLHTEEEGLDVKPYKAKKVKVNETFINSAPAQRETIDKVNNNNNNGN